MDRSRAKELLAVTVGTGSFSAAGRPCGLSPASEQIFADTKMQAREAIPPGPDEGFGTARMQNVVPRA